MNQIMLAYTLSPKDAEQYATLFPQVTGFRKAVQMGDELLSSLRALSMPDEQKLALSAYLIAYSIVAGDPKVDAKLRILLKTIKVSQRFLARVRESVQPLRFQLGDDPLSMMLRPPEMLQKRLSELVKYALQEGEHRSRKIITDLSPKEYEHNVDRIALGILKKAKGLDYVVQAAYKHGLDRLLTTYTTASCLRIGPRQFPDVYEIFMEACETIDMEHLPDFYAIPGGDIFTTFAGIENPLIGISAECLEKINHEELLFAVGRDLGHIKSGYTLYMEISNLIFNQRVVNRLTGGLGSIPLLGSVTSVVTTVLEFALTQWQWATDYTVDRVGLLCCQNIDVALNCLIKMSGAPEKYYSQINIETFKEQVREFDALNSNLLDRAFKTTATMLRPSEDKTSPWTISRAHELIKWYESGEYQRILDRVPFTPEEASDDEELEKSFFGSLKNKIGFGSSKPDTGGFCPECGSPNDGNSKFCQQCGKPL